MTESTRVPLQPIGKGSLGKLWLGVAAVALAAGGIAVAALPDVVQVETVSEGSGPAPGNDDVAFINYVGKLRDGKVFDQGREVPMPLGQVVPGFRDGLVQMKTGGKYRLVIPAAKAYGSEEKRNPMTGEVVIPANSDLTFEIDLLETMPRAQFEQMMQMRQMMQSQGGGQQGGAPERPAAPGE